MIHYLSGKVASGKSFYNREYQIRTILDGGWTWICGQRRIGKTSLLFQLEIEAKKRNWVPLFLDLTTLGEYSGKGLLETFLLTHKRTLKKYGISKKDFSPGYPVESFYQLISDLAEKETQTIFLWDEAEKLIETEENDPGILNKIRARLSQIRDFRLVISGTQLLSALYRYQSETVSSFLHTFHWKPLPALDPEDAKALLRCDQEGGWNSPLPNKIVDNAVRWSGGHPLMLHELGIQLSEKTGENGETADTETLQRCFNSLQKNPNLKDIIRDDYAKLTDEQQHILRKIVEAGNEISFDQLAAEKISPDMLTDSLHFLENYSYITWDADGFVRLRFIFYPEFLQFATQKSLADAKKVSLIRRTILISYSHKDQAYFNDLKTHLTHLVRKDETDAWDDTRIETDKSENMERALTRAQVVVFLISPDFLNSRFITENDSPKFIVTANMKGCKILNLFVRPSVADQVSYKIKDKKINLTDFHALNLPDQPLSKLDDDAKDEMLSRCAKEIVLQTRNILGPDSPINAISDKNTDSRSLDQNISKVFISYAKADSEIAKKLHNDLEKAGVATWIDDEKLLPGQDSELEIKKAIRNSSYFLAILSGHSVTKQGLIQKEMKEALDLYKERVPGEIFIIPVRTDDCELAYEELQNIHCADLFPSYQKGLEKILRVFVQGQDHMVC